MKEKIDLRRWESRDWLLNRVCMVIVLLGFVSVIFTPVTAVTTSINIIKYANDGTTILNSTAKTYQWLESNLPVMGDGITHYYSQGPTFNGSDYWDDAEWQNIETRDWGAVKGTDLKDLCNLVGGMSAGETVRIEASDGLRKIYPYEYIYSPNSRQGPMGIAWFRADQGYVPDYSDGMRLIMFADAKTNTYGWNTSGWHVFGNADMRDCWAPNYWYNYTGTWPSSGGVSVKTVSNISIYSNQAPPVAPVAAFTNGTPRIGTAPLTVTFTDQSTGTAPLSYRWDFNNDGVSDSTVRNPSHVYSGAGTYSVNLTVTNSAGSDSEVKTGYVVVNPAPVAPVAAFTNATPRIGSAPLTITFTDQSTGNPTSWEWEYRSGSGSWTEFGSGTRNPSRTFSAGTYDIRLTVTNAGGSDNELKSGFITASPPTALPVAGFYANSTSGIVPLAVKFNDQSTGTGITAWRWDFNNDRIIDSTLQNPSFVYTSPGTYTVNLTVTNSDGSDSELKTNYISVNSVPVVQTPNLTQIGIFRPSTGYWYFDFNLDSIVNKSIRFGGSTDQITVGDFNGDGKDGIAIFRPSTGYWYFDNNLDGTVDKSFRYGGNSDNIIVGKWQGSLQDGIAIFRPSTGYWYFDYNLDGTVDKSFRYGGITDRIIKGDWQGTGNDGIAIFRPSTGYWYFDYNLDGTVDKSFRYGGNSDNIIVGKWQGSLQDGIAIFRPSTGYWYFDYNLDGIVDKSFRYGGSNDQIIVGNWQGSNDGIAIFRPSTGYWYFDYNLDGTVDKSLRYGGNNDQIIVGKWT
jgi:PKD repeat protein